MHRGWAAPLEGDVRPELGPLVGGIAPLLFGVLPALLNIVSGSSSNLCFQSIAGLIVRLVGAGLALSGQIELVPAETR